MRAAFSPPPDPAITDAVRQAAEHGDHVTPDRLDARIAGTPPPLRPMIRGTRMFDTHAIARALTESGLKPEQASVQSSRRCGSSPSDPLAGRDRVIRDGES